MPHGYTNRTAGDGRVVVKSYHGPDADTRFRRERVTLRAVAGRLPVPPVIDSGDWKLTLGFMRGAHGQDLIDVGHAEHVLRASGMTLSRIHGLSAEFLAGVVSGDGSVLVHGDYGPNNLLIDPVAWEVTAIVDWEWAHLGEPVEDLAWCEWIVRTHHPEETERLGVFFDAYEGDVPAWPDRHAVMLARCRWLRDFCERWEPGGPGVTLWEQRTARTAQWAA